MLTLYCSSKSLKMKSKEVVLFSIVVALYLCQLAMQVTAEAVAEPGSAIIARALTVCDPPCSFRECCLQKQQGLQAVCEPVPLSGYACSYPNHRPVFSIDRSNAITGHHCPCLIGMVCLARDGSGAAQPGGVGLCSFLK